VNVDRPPGLNMSQRLIHEFETIFQIIEYKPVLEVSVVIVYKLESRIDLNVQTSLVARSDA